MRPGNRRFLARWADDDRWICSQSARVGTGLDPLEGRRGLQHADQRCGKRLSGGSNQWFLTVKYSIFDAFCRFVQARGELKLGLRLYAGNNVVHELINPEVSPLKK